MSRSETELSPGYLVKRVQQSLRRRCDGALRPTGLSMAQYAAMRALDDMPEASASDLARRCFVTRQSLQDLLAGLRSAGLVADAPSAPRGRARALELTPAGRQRLADGDAAVDDVDTAMVADLTPTQRRQLAAMLVRCAENLEAEG
jgi:DNA-binding MarR family transcriptional regulator